MFNYISSIILINQSTALHSNIIMLYFFFYNGLQIFISLLIFWPISIVAFFLLNSHS